METYTYAGDGKRRQKVTASGTTNFIWDGQNVLAELDQNQVTQAQHTHPPGIWGGLTSQRRSGVSSYYGFDLAGNTRALVSSAGAITDSYGYKAFGAELPGSGSTTNPHRYCGVLGYYRDNASRHYVRARHLRADSGRWMSMDPIGFDGGDANLYRYGGNQPFAGGDPSGLALTERLCYEDSLKCYAGKRDAYNACTSSDPLSKCLDKCWAAVNGLSWLGIGLPFGIGGVKQLGTIGYAKGTGRSSAMEALKLIEVTEGRRFFLPNFKRIVRQGIKNLVGIQADIILQYEAPFVAFCVAGCYASYSSLLNQCADILQKGVQDCDDSLQLCLQRARMEGGRSRVRNYSRRGGCTARALLGD